MINQLPLAIHAFSIVFIFFEGYVQGASRRIAVSLVGGALQASITSSDFILVARVVIGIGIGDLRISAYWLSFALPFIQNGYSDFQWRFLLAFQFIPALFLALSVKFFPNSPQYLASVGRTEEAQDVLTRLKSPVNPRRGRPGVPRGHPRRRVSETQFSHLICQNPPRTEWTAAVTAYFPVLLSQAGYSEITQNGLVTGLNSIGVDTIISAQIVDRIGRRNGGSVYEGPLGHPENASQYVPAAAATLFLFNLDYAATWGTVTFLIPTEIFPSDLCTQGNGFNITGWAITVCVTMLVNPIMFDRIKSPSYFILAGLNLIWIPGVVLFRDMWSLELIETLFETHSALPWDMEQTYQEHGNGLVEQHKNGRESPGKIEGYIP
ncbi:hypothetical protein EYZ11_003019 [Aspergillus tanneri]|uniref:Major facilitator superfamily (MFS) profile domain-containing protein n=1 Tax=Aspergillus tanneri TaxID=1220188 RepID=A0A4S3JPH1_9EURO|nr:hypothetical protein EYZ11_003019 [Aspergillus tanneri]